MDDVTSHRLDAGRSHAQDGGEAGIRKQTLLIIAITGGVLVVATLVAVGVCCLVRRQLKRYDARTKEIRGALQSLTPSKSKSVSERRPPSEIRPPQVNVATSTNQPAPGAPQPPHLPVAQPPRQEMVQQLPVVPKRKPASKKSASKVEEESGLLLCDSERGGEEMEGLRVVAVMLSEESLSHRQALLPPVEEECEQREEEEDGGYERPVTTQRIQEATECRLAEGLASRVVMCGAKEWWSGGGAVQGRKVTTDGVVGQKVGLTRVDGGDGENVDVVDVFERDVDDVKVVKVSSEGLDGALAVEVDGVRADGDATEEDAMGGREVSKKRVGLSRFLHHKGSSQKSSSASSSKDSTSTQGSGKVRSHAGSGEGEKSKSKSKKKKKVPKSSSVDSDAKMLGKSAAYHHHHRRWDHTCNNGKGLTGQRKGGQTM